MLDRCVIVRAPTRAVDDLPSAVGVDSGSPSPLSRIRVGLDEVVTAFRSRRLKHTEFPGVDLDATYLHVRNATSQVLSTCVLWADAAPLQPDYRLLSDVGRRDPSHEPNGLRRESCSTTMVESTTPIAVCGSLNRTWMRSGSHMVPVVRRSPAPVHPARLRRCEVLEGRPSG